MKQIEKSILIVIIIILVAIIASGATYIIMSNKNDNNSNQESSNPNKESQELESNKQTIFFTEDELKDYLSILPRDIYSNQKTSLNTIDKDILLSKLLTDESSCWTEKTCDFDMNQKLKVVDYYPEKYLSEYDYMEFVEGYMPLDYVKKQMLKVYNVNISEIENNKEFNYNYGFVYHNNYFMQTGGGDPSEYESVSYIDDYEVENNNLIIYEYMANFIENEINFSKYEDAVKYLKEHKSDFPRYKHTFKKNATGYYWYSTEIEK